MKLSVAIADHDAPPSAFVVWRGFEESLAKAADLGYHGVELALRRTEDVDTDRLAALLDRCGLEVSAISTGQVWACDRLCLVHADAAVRQGAEAALQGLIRLAGRFGGLVNIGRARGQVAEVGSRDEAERLLAEAMARLADMAGPLGVELILEPINRYEVDFLHTLDEAAAVLERVGRPNVGLMPDVFHMNIEESRIGEALSRHGRRVRYMHLADSNRHAPGWGHLDFDEVFGALQRAGFDGWAAAEILPVPEPDAAARQAAATLLPMIDQFNSAR